MFNVLDLYMSCLEATIGNYIMFQVYRMFWVIIVLITAKRCRGRNRLVSFQTSVK